MSILTHGGQDAICSIAICIASRYNRIMKNEQLTKALITIDETLIQVTPRNEDDEAALDWLGHLNDVRTQLVEGKMTIKKAEESLGIKLI